MRIATLTCAALACASLGLLLGCGGKTTENAPTVTGFSPAFGPVSTVITVTGSGYAIGVNGVTLGGVAVASNAGAVVSDTSLTFQVPSAAITGSIAVTTPGGTVSSATQFIVTPVINTLAPATGSAAAGTPVTINGSGLLGITQITFGSVTATPTVHTANQIVVPVPATAPVGALTITFQVNPSYAQANLLSSFTVTK